MVSTMATSQLTSRVVTRIFKPETASRGYRVSTACLAKATSSPPKEQTYPLLPSVQHLLHENGLDISSIKKMTPSGPNNRLLKGDVLAFLGSISASYPADLSSRIEKLTHLDLSNIKVAPPTLKTTTGPSIPEPVAVPEDIEVVASISMVKVLEVQKRIQSSLGVLLPLSTFIARATDLANDDLPRSTAAKPSAEDLFNAVLGLDKLRSAGVRGNFMPQITALPHASARVVPREARKPASSSFSSDIDIIDFLAGRKTGKEKSTRSVSSVSVTKASTPDPSLGGRATLAHTNIFAVTVAKGEEGRARVFLDRVRTVLEGEPGRLVV